MKYKPLAPFALILILLGCDQQQDQQLASTEKSNSPPFTRETDQGARNPAAHALSMEAIAFKECAKTTDDRALNRDEDGLRVAQEFMNCSENYLEKFPDGPHAEELEKLRYNAIVASKTILQALEEGDKLATSGSLNDMQQRLVSRESVKKLAVTNAQFINRAFQYQTIKSFHQLYLSLKAAGIKMESALEALNQANLSRKRSGVWEIYLSRSYDEGRFIVVGEFGSHDPEFVVAGLGVVSPHVEIIDTELEKRGWFSETCSVKIQEFGRSLTYPCTNYLAGNANENLVSEISKGLASAMKEKEDAGR
ncbi:hypothetical protein ACLIKD_08915 [Azonexus sp. IMCC34842]|uniref:hypothetical protein n=1 Tax=Azonexus sp. IMCC34842 TaxID=3420950 RepID=UPI003D12754C